MASIQDAVNKNVQRYAAGGEPGTAPQPPATPLISTPPQDMPLGGGLPQRGTIPISSVNPADINDSNRMFRGSGSRSTVYPYPNRPALVSNAPSVQAVTPAAVSAATAALSIQVNGAPTPSQVILDLIAGSGIVLTPDATGGITIDSTAAGDGLIHGDAIWDVDDAVVFDRDDFNFAGGVVSNVGYGSLGWYAAGTTGGIYVSNNPPYLGGLQWPNSASANVGVSFFPGTVGAGHFSTSMMPLLEYPGWKLIWEFEISRALSVNFSSSLLPAFSFAQTSFYIGLQTALSLPVTWGRPSIFIGLRYDTDTTSPSINDATMKFEVVTNALVSSRNNAQGTVVDTGLTPTEGQSYRLEIECTTAGTITMSLNGATPVSFVVPKMTVQSSGTNIAVGANGLGYVGYNSAVNGVSPFTTGSTVSVAAQAGLTGTWPVFEGDNGSDAVIIGPGIPTVGSTVQANSITGYPAYYPSMLFGNDSSLGPTANSKAVTLDFYGFVWNPGVGGGTGTPTATDPRYW